MKCARQTTKCQVVECVAWLGIAVAIIAPVFFIDAEMELQKETFWHDFLHGLWAFFLGNVGILLGLAIASIFGNRFRCMMIGAIVWPPLFIWGGVWLSK